MIKCCLVIAAGSWPLVQSVLKQLMARHTGHERCLRLRVPLMQMSDERVRELFSTFDATGYDLPAAA